MKRVLIARYEAKTLMTAVFPCVLVGILLIAYPCLKYGGPEGLFRNLLATAPGLISLLSGAAILTLISYLLFRVISTQFVGMHVSNDLLYWRTPLAGKIKLDNIADVYAPIEKFRARILIVTKDGKSLAIATRLFHESRDKIVRLIRQVAAEPSGATAHGAAARPSASTEA